MANDIQRLKEIWLRELEILSISDMIETIDTYENKFNLRAVNENCG